MRRSLDPLFDKVGFVGSYDAIDRVIDRSVEDCERAGGYGRRRFLVANRVQSRGVPIGDDVASSDGCDAQGHEETQGFQNRLCLHCVARSVGERTPSTSHTQIMQALMNRYQFQVLLKRIRVPVA